MTRFAALTGIGAIRDLVAPLHFVIVATPVVSILSYQWDGVYIGAAAAAAMMWTMAMAFAVYLLLLDPLTEMWGLTGLWADVLIFMGVRGVGQTVWYPRLEKGLG